VDEHNAITRIGSDPAETLPDSGTLRGGQLHTRAEMRTVDDDR
jgi:aspartate 1-decarboxylase